MKFFPLIEWRDSMKKLSILENKLKWFAGVEYYGIKIHIVLSVKRE